MKTLYAAILTLLLTASSSYATLTPGQVPVTKIGGGSPVLQNGSITDTGTASGPGNVGINSTSPGQTLDVYGTIRSVSNSGTISGVIAQDTNSAGEAIVQVKNDVGNSVYIAANGSTDSPGAGALAVGVSAGQTLDLGDANNANMVSILNGNVGIGSVGPVAPLDVQGSVRIGQTISTATTLDCTVVKNSDGSICSGNGGPNGTVPTTTGTNNSGQNVVNVSSSATFTAGEGVAIQNAGTGGNTELISYITSISGNALTLHDNLVSTITSGQNVTHDDTRALTDAAQSGLNVHLRSGYYNVTSAIIFNGTEIFQGDGLSDYGAPGTPTTGSNASIIWNRGKTNNVLDLVTNGSTLNTIKISDLSVVQATGITPTAGYAYILAGSTGAHIHDMILENFSFIGVFGGISIGNGSTTGNISRSYFRNGQVYIEGLNTTEYGLYINNAISYGDNWFQNLYLGVTTGGNTGDGLYITAADTNTFDHVKFFGELHGVVIDDSHGTVVNERFIDPSCEGATTSSGELGCFDISATSVNDVYNIIIDGGECNAAAAVYCVEVDDDVRSVSISNMVMLGGGAGGILLKNSKGNDVINNITCSNLSSCLALSSSSKPSNVSFSNINCNSDITACVLNAGAVQSVFGETASNYNINVGIGTYPTRSMLDVNGTVNGTQLFDVQGTQGLGFEVNSAGNVSIGSATPVAALDVVGTVRISSGASQQAVCFTSANELGKCTSVVGAGGACTCVAI
jgi:hypothetical protein